MLISRNEAPRSTDELRARSVGVLSSERGSVTVEYTVLLCVVSLGCVFAIIGLGVPLVRMYQANQVWLLLPIP